MADLLDMPRLSLKERNGRWARIRAAMAERDIACIISAPHTGHWELYQADCRYMTHIGGNNSETSCVFPADGDVMAVVLNRPEFWAIAQDWVQDIRTPQQHMWTLPMIDKMKDIGIGRHKVGVIGLNDGLRTKEGLFPAGMLTRFQDAFPDAEFVDVTTMMGNLRGVKTAEEILCMERACAMVETGIQRILATAKPGMPDYQVYAEYYYGIMSEGTEIPTMVLWGSGPGHARDAFLPTHRPLQKGDVISNELEAKYVGYNAQRVQPIYLGDPPEADLKAMEKHRAVFNRAMETMKPGVKFSEIVATIGDVSTELDCVANVTMHGRGLGEDRPLLVGGSMNEEVLSFTLQEGNVFIVKPAVTPNGGPTAHWGDTVKVTASGGQRLGKDAHEIMVIS